MNAQEIRQLNEYCQKKALETRSASELETALRSLELSLLTEMAAQFAEANESLKKIADPQVVNGTSPWVTMTYNGRTYLVNKGAVAIVEKGNDTQCIITMHNEGGENPGRWCDGTMKEVCSKLGIPVDGL